MSVFPRSVWSDPFDPLPKKPHTRRFTAFTATGVDERRVTLTGYVEVPR